MPHSPILVQMTYKLQYHYWQYGAWATSKKLPCLHKAYYTTTGVLAVPTQTTGVLAVPIRAGTVSRQVACYGRTSRDTPATRSSRSRHDNAELSSRGKRSNRVVHGPVQRTLSPSAGLKRFSSRGVLLVAVIHSRSATG